MTFKESRKRFFYASDDLAENHDRHIQNDIFDCDCETCVRRQREHIKQLAEMVA